MTVLSLIAFGSIKATILILEYLVIGFGLSIGFALFKKIQNHFYLNNMEKAACQEN